MDNNTAKLNPALIPEINFRFFNPKEDVEHVKGNLPHWRQAGKIYFVTFRTADSLPQEILRAWKEEIDIWNRQNSKPHTHLQRQEYHRRFSVRVHQFLDAGYGVCLLAKPALKSLVKDAIRHFDGDRYHLDEFVVAINHVHVLVEPLRNHSLSEILRTWKSFTANEINKATGNTGAFWRKEYFDHLVRNEAALDKFREYIKAHKDYKPFIHFPPSG